jgi:glycosyl transferase family 25
MHIFVINLEKDAARRASITGQLSALGLPFELVPGVLGSALSAAELALHYDDGKAKWRMARSLLPAEIGCALSHVNVYRMMVARDIPFALVLEDDVSLPGGLGEVLDACAAVVDPRRPQVWLLSPAEGWPGGPGERALGTQHILSRYRGGFYTSSYLLTACAAKALLAELYPIGDVADCWRRLNQYRVVDLHVVSPPVIRQDHERFGSSTTLDYYARVDRGLRSTLLYKLRRARAILRDAFYAPYRRRWRPYSGLRFTGMFWE